jgi:hypothetical protein
MMSNENRPNQTGNDTWNQPYIPTNPAYPPAADLDYDARLKEATKRVQKKINFYRTLTSYLIINAFLWILWFMTGSSYPWPVWVSLGWGIGLAFQALDAFALGVTDQQRREMIEEEMRRMGRSR